MTRVLIVSTDMVGPTMAGPGIRAWEMARTLAATHEVVLAVPGDSPLQSDTFQLISYHSPQVDMAHLVEQNDVLVGQGFVFEHFPVLLQHSKPVAIDLYDPLILESLDLLATADPATAQAHYTRYQQLTNAQLQRGDFFFCATSTQRDYWLGALTASGRITPQLLHHIDRDLHGLIDLVPSGIAPQPPVRQGPALRGVHPAIQDDDILCIWAGGLWEWFDPCILIRALKLLQEECPRLKLCFFAGARPNPSGEPFRTRTYTQAVALARELDLLDRSVIFLEHWVAYHERGTYLAEADIGVSAHMAGVETRMAFRTRLLDYVWARLPIICSAGDSLSKDLTDNGVGLLVEPDDVSGWVAALRAMATDAQRRGRCRAAADQLAPRFTWDRVMCPLAAFCAQPQRTSVYTSIEQMNDLRQAVADRDIRLRDLEQRAAWLHKQAATARQELDAIKQGRLLRLLNWIQRRYTL